jgi:hypothetical protein
VKSKSVFLTSGSEILYHNSLTYTIFTSNRIPLNAGPAMGQLILRCYCMGFLKRKIYKMHLLTLALLSLRLPVSRHINWCSGYVLLWNFTNIYRKNLTSVKSDNDNGHVTIRPSWISECISNGSRWTLITAKYVCNKCDKEQDRQCKYIVTLRCGGVTNIAVERQ